MSNLASRYVSPLPAWQDRAACRGADLALFYPPRGSYGQDNTRAAKAICARCPVVDDCLAWALATKDEHGVLGGTSPDERRRMRRQQRRRNNPCGTVAAYRQHLRAGEVPDDECRRAAAMQRTEQRHTAAAS